MWYEADLDKLMTRTCLRPIPTGKVNREHALVFGILLSVISILGLYYYANTLSAILLFITISFYLFVYTIWLKRKTPQNIVIGGVAGALPPVIGWTIATNTLTFEPITFFLIIFFWTPSHFWALSLYKIDDYKKANIPMLPITNGIEVTKKNIFIYSLVMIPVVLIPYFIGFTGEFYLVISLLLTFYYNLVCYKLLNFKKNKFEIDTAKKVFAYSIFYLFLLFVLFLIDKLI
jgi:protoheme IX farnesyltransferase